MTDTQKTLASLLEDALKKIAPMADAVAIHIERPRDPTHGDFACNIAMLLAKPLKKNPRDIALQICAALPISPLIAEVYVAGAGFINFRLQAGEKLAVIRRVLAEGANFGRLSPIQKKTVQVEFVSANPTGPLHVGHGRGAAYGASLANLLDFAGFDVTREYYVNDAGRQMDILALSTWLRYLEILGEQVSFPENAYQGDYVREMASALQQKMGPQFFRALENITEEIPDTLEKEARLDALILYAKKVLGADWAAVHQHALSVQLADVREDLSSFGVHFDVWFSEKALFDEALVAKAIQQLDDKGFLYTKDGARWFRSTDFGDEKDRVVQRENGVFTYFASDIAYHQNKYERGFDRLINVWGADHHGYIPRVKGAVSALGLPAENLDIALVQFAVLYREGQKVSMSTRAGEFVTLRTLRDEVGNDACRFFYAMRKSDQHLDFDLDLAKSQRNENPVYYIQYAHARIASVLKTWGGDVALLKEADLALLVDPLELSLSQALEKFPEMIVSAAADLSPHLIAFYLKNLAAAFHTWYNAKRMLDGDAALQNARLALAAATAQVIKNGLLLLGVSCPERM